MRRVQIITDSCSDLRADQLSRYQIDYARMSTVYEGVESPASLTWSREEAHALYEIMRKGTRVTTAQVSVEEFRRVFEIYLKQDRDIVYIGCSSKQSGSVNTGTVTARRMMEEYPGSRIVCIDSLNASLGEGMLAIAAAEMAETGASAEEIGQHILAIRKTVNQFVTVHSLTALRRAGRVKGPAAFFGNLMGVKPIIVSDVHGEQVAYKKVKGRAASLCEIVAQLKAVLSEAEEKTVYIAHADCAEEEIGVLAETVRREIPGARVEIGLIGPIIGASIGPDAVGIWGFGSPVTFTLGE